MASGRPHGLGKFRRWLLVIALGGVAFLRPRRWVLSGALLGPQLARAAAAPKDQVAAAMRKLDELADPDNFKKIAVGGGDNIRREVGTVGMSSPLFDVDKAFKALAEEAGDPEAYVETLERFSKALQNADSDAYSSIFSMNSAAATNPQVYIDNSYKEVLDAQRSARELLAMLKMS
ncbi:unnamed protein product [Effrenium voratum]|uniref:Uncharacterized protein n=2 Tax=Effrenium voratum TaxID=2562239 RepID=A0AA36MSH8_9DINO|nr:unnamed protein product [Effrenium voratum]CAJ1425552.1 unnamed protein product [Effrenium voratum]